MKWTSWTPSRYFFTPRDSLLKEVSRQCQGQEKALLEDVCCLYDLKDKCSTSCPLFLYVVQIIAVAIIPSRLGAGVIIIIFFNQLVVIMLLLVFGLRFHVYRPVYPVRWRCVFSHIFVISPQCQDQCWTIVDAEQGHLGWFHFPS